MTMEWMASAACRDEEPELFFAEGTSGAALADTQQAQAICLDCTVRTQCADHADTIGATAGIWGGLNDAQRAARRRNRVRV